MGKYKISIVSYINTFPLLFGIENSEELLSEIELHKDIPSVCAEKLISNQVDIGLVPVAILKNLDNYNIITDYCIGSENKVDSVLLVSDVPINEIENVLLDYQSRTSVNLAKVLAKHHWEKEFNWINSSAGYENNIEGKTAGVIIGDRTFNLSKGYKYKYDLSEEWYNFTGLPFVFACWVTTKNPDSLFIEKFNSAMLFGLKNISKSIDKYLIKSEYNKNVINNYLTSRISYNLDNKKQESLKFFLSLI